MYENGRVTQYNNQGGWKVCSLAPCNDYYNQSRLDNGQKLDKENNK